MKVVLFFALASLLGTQAAPACRKNAEDGEEDGVVSLSLSFNDPVPIDGEPPIVHKAANVPHDVP